MPKSLLSSRRRSVEANEGVEPNRKHRLGGVDAKRKRLYGGDGGIGGREGRGGRMRSGGVGDVKLRTRINAERRLSGKLGKMRSVGGGADDVMLRARVGDERRGKREFDERVKAKREGRGGRMGSVDGADDGEDVRLRTRVVAGRMGKIEFDERVKMEQGMSTTRRKEGRGRENGEESEKGFGKGGDLDKESVKGERNRHRGGALEGYANKKKDKKDEEEVENDTPKKRKRIKLDPYDVSNKRMDDGVSMDGRSNVGKSSLLNALTRQWGVARTSDKPGLTQVKEYVSTRVGLKRVCFMIDTKWGMKPRDHELVHLMERSQTKYQILLTKTDMIFPIDVARLAMEIEEVR
ncbi:hypothetical protein Scep_014065 [Stephania cephalantha]|uniref:G domain-containing protein n=1 Tax=Stephania cephalantha TaxID=152367 RepID=A0AAP0J0K7_9MAGN